jgi:ribonuclease HI
MKQVTIYTDGACINNPGAGGYGVVILSDEGRQELSGGYRLTTNNRMELMGAIVGLSALPEKSIVTLYSDSQYVVNGVTAGWAKKWRANGWMRTKSEKAINPDLWAQLLDLTEAHRVNFQWVRGHAGNPENERCDHLAVTASQQKNLPPDLGYESS